MNKSTDRVGGGVRRRGGVPRLELQPCDRADALQGRLLGGRQRRLLSLAGVMATGWVARARYVTGFTGLATQFQSHVTQYPPYGGPLV